MLSIKEIDGVQAVRVHLAEGEKSVFVRDQIALRPASCCVWPMGAN
jgi:flagellar biosynthesis/type III secretory pathway M-ring protein FliF/YscJ